MHRCLRHIVVTAAIAFAVILSGCGQGTSTSLGTGPATTSNTPTSAGGPTQTRPGAEHAGTPTTTFAPPPLTDTTVAWGPAPPGPLPDATNGVVRGQVGGSACPRQAQMCTAMYRFVPATVTLSGFTSVTVHTNDSAPDFGFTVRVPPGRYSITAEPDQPNDCVAAHIDVLANQINEVSIDCAPTS